MNDILLQYINIEVKVHVIGGEVFRGKVSNFNKETLLLKRTKSLSAGQEEVQTDEIIINKITCIETSEIQPVG